MDRFALQVLFFPLPTTPLSTSLKKQRQSNIVKLNIQLNKFEDLIGHTIVPSFIDAFFSFFGFLTGQKRFRQEELPENYKMLLNKTTPTTDQYPITISPAYVSTHRGDVIYLFGSRPLTS